MVFLNLLLGALLVGQMLWTLTALLPRRLALGASLAVYLLGSFPMQGWPALRCFLPNFHIFQICPLDGQVLLINALYCAVWIAYLAFSGWIASRR